MTEMYQSLSIPELNKINNLVNLIPKNKKIIIIMKNGGSQTPYEIIEKQTTITFLWIKN